MIAGTTAKLLLPLLLISSLAWSQQANPPIEIGYDTTRITKPLRPDGTVDYLAALNQLLSEGVTRENNAAVLLVQAFDPQSFLPEQIREQVLEMLDVRPSEGQYFRGHEEFDISYEQYDLLLDGPWRDEDHPNVWIWLKTNEVPLHLLIEASKRPRYYMPVVTDDAQALLDVLLPHLGIYRAAARAFIIRANRAIADGRVEDAWRDIGAVHRLGSLVVQDRFLISYLIGLAMDAMASTATATMATEGGLKPAEARHIVAELTSLPPLPSLAASIDQGERFFVLDGLQMMAHERGEDWLTAFDIDMPADRTGQMVFINDVDFNQIMRRFNGYFDALVKALNMPPAERPEALERIKRRMAAISQRSQGIPFSDISNKPGQVKALWMGDRLLSSCARAYTRSIVITESVAQLRDLALLAVALAGHVAEHGRYPESLDALAPDWLAEIPQDRFSGKPLHYSRTDEGYVLYSVGENGVDDGGKGDIRGYQGDIVIRVGNNSEDNAGPSFGPPGMAPSAGPPVLPGPP